MLCQVCRRGRLQAFIQHQDHVNSDVLCNVSAILNPDTKAKADILPICESRLPAAVYNKFLLFIQSRQPDYRDYRQLPHPADSLILSPWGCPMKTATHQTRGLSIFTLHPGNSSISFQNGSGDVYYGFIQFMWSHSLAGTPNTYLLVSRHIALSSQDAHLNPYQKLPELKCLLVYSHVPSLDAMERMVIIDKEQVRSQVAYYIRPPGTFGIKRETIILVDLFRNQ
jgi:hypothetical protein